MLLQLTTAKSNDKLTSQGEKKEAKMCHLVYKCLKKEWIVLVQTPYLGSRIYMFMTVFEPLQSNFYHPI